MLHLVIIMRQTPQTFLDMPVGEWFCSWQLIWRENPPDCPLLVRYTVHYFNLLVQTSQSRLMSLEENVFFYTL